MSIKVFILDFDHVIEISSIMNFILKHFVTNWIFWICIGKSLVNNFLKSINKFIDNSINKMSINIFSKFGEIFVIIYLEMGEKTNKRRKKEWGWEGGRRGVGIWGRGGNDSGDNDNGGSNNDGSLEAESVVMQEEEEEEDEEEKEKVDKEEEAVTRTITTTMAV